MNSIVFVTTFWMGCFAKFEWKLWSTGTYTDTK